MNQAEDLSLDAWRVIIDEVFERWHDDSVAHPSFAQTYLFRKAHRAGVDGMHQAMRTVFERALTTLSTQHPQAVQLLHLRFLENKKVYAVASKLDVAESTVYKLQRRALDLLATILMEMEHEARTADDTMLESRLEPPNYTQLVGVETQLASLQAVLTTPGPPWLVCLEGIGGIGKTTLADALLRRLIGCSDFIDLGWVSARRTIFNLGGALQPLATPALTVDALLEKLADQLLADMPKPTPFAAEKLLALLGEQLRQSAHLIVIDNLETLADLESLLPVLRRLTDPTKFLLTSRQSLYAEADMYHFRVQELQEDDALRLIRHEARLRNLPDLAAANDAELHPIFATVGGNPLALRLVVGQTHVHELAVVLADLAAAQGATVENLYHYVYERAWHNLDEISRRALLAMPLTTERGGTLAYVAEVSGLEPGDLRTALNQLVALNLVDSRGGLHERRYTIHSLTRTFLQDQVARW